TDTSDPSRVMMRQIAGAFAQYEKARLVARLKRSRDRKKAEIGKCGGRRSHAESRPEAEAEGRNQRARPGSCADYADRREPCTTLVEVAPALQLGGDLAQRPRDALRSLATELLDERHYHRGRSLSIGAC